ncbi:MAG: alanine racemase, partial [candidate division Zixibacteria bacterium]|nr:alanine racemase [candidate division Zixibacteria bacterium]
MVCDPGVKVKLSEKTLVKISATLTMEQQVVTLHHSPNFLIHLKSKIKGCAVDEVGLRRWELDTPFLWVDLDRMERNIETLGAHFVRAGVGWRPHTKGVKVPAIAHKAIAAGALGVTCAKLGEAEVMVAAGIRDILVANQVVGPRKYVRLVNLCRQADVKIAVDSDATLADLGKTAVAKGVRVGILIELDTGMNRAGVKPGAPTVELACRVHETPGLAMRGLMAWEGHACVDETDPGKNTEIARSVGLLIETAEQCRHAGLPCDIVSGGGSGTYLVTPFIKGVTEIQAGGAIFNDVMYSGWGVTTEPSLYLTATVTSRPTPERILYDAGWKALPAWFNIPKAMGVEGVREVAPSAEHGKLVLDAPNHAIRAGDRLDFMIGYTDTTLFLHDHLYGIRGDVVETVWPIHGRGKLR